jgi:hypothetical protein
MKHHRQGDGPEFPIGSLHLTQFGVDALTGEILDERADWWF